MARARTSKESRSAAPPAARSGGKSTALVRASSSGRIVRKPPQSGAFKDARVKAGELARKEADVVAIQDAATTRRARERLDHFDETRDALKLSLAGYSQREIADLLRTTQPRVHRMLRAVEHREPAEESPEEVILRARVAGSNRDDLMKCLVRLNYTFRKTAPEGSEGALSGSWDQVRLAARSGLLSKSEFERVRDAVKPPKS